MKKIKVKFDKGINTIHIPFISSNYDELYAEIIKIVHPKSVKKIEAVHKVTWNKQDGLWLESSEVVVKK